MSAEALLNTFLTETNDETAYESEYKLCPEIASAPAQIKKWDLKAGTYVDRNTQQEEVWARLQLSWTVDSPEAREAIGRDEVVIRQNVMLSFERGTSRLDKNNNIALGRLFKLLDIDPVGLTNKEMFDCLVGKQAAVKVAHVALMKGKNDPMLDTEGNQVYSAEVTAVGALD